MFLVPSGKCVAARKLCIFINYGTLSRSDRDDDWSFTHVLRAYQWCRIFLGSLGLSFFAEGVNKLAVDGPLSRISYWQAFEKPHRRIWKLYDVFSCQVREDTYSIDGSQPVKFYCCSVCSLSIDVLYINEFVRERCLAAFDALDELPL